MSTMDSKKSAIHHKIRENLIMASQEWENSSK